MADVKKYETMAMLRLPDEEREMLSSRLDDLISGFEALRQVNTNDVKPLVTVLDLSNVLREDVCKKTFSREEILANAPEQYDGFFVVPGTIG